jgi:hypothetical protein
MERNYVLTGKTPAKALSGQAAAIFAVMTAATVDGKPAAKTAKQWTELSKGKFATRQDEYRVVLYYLLIFKKRGLVASQDVVNQETGGHTELEGQLADALHDVVAQDGDDGEGAETEEPEPVEQA